MISEYAYEELQKALEEDVDWLNECYNEALEELEMEYMFSLEEGRFDLEYEICKYEYFNDRDMGEC